MSLRFDRLSFQSSENGPWPGDSIMSVIRHLHRLHCKHNNFFTPCVHTIIFREVFSFARKPDQTAFLETACWLLIFVSFFGNRDKSTKKLNNKTNGKKTTKASSWHNESISCVIRWLHVGDKKAWNVFIYFFLLNFMDLFRRSSAT